MGYIDPIFDKVSADQISIIPLSNLEERKTEGMTPEQSLPPDKQTWGTRKEFDGTKLGIKARRFFKEQLKFDYDDVTAKPVYTKGSGRDATFFIPVAQGPLGYYWEATRFTVDPAVLAAIGTEQQQSEAQAAIIAAQQARDKAKADAEIRKLQAETAALNAQAGLSPDGSAVPAPPAKELTIFNNGNSAFTAVSAQESMDPAGPHPGVSGAGPGMWEKFVGTNVKPEAVGLPPGQYLLAYNNGNFGAATQEYNSLLPEARTGDTYAQQVLRGLGISF